MIKISELLGKPLIAVREAKTVGYVSNVRFDAFMTRAKVAEVTCDEDDFPERTFVRFCDVDGEGDAAVISSVAKLHEDCDPAAVMPSPVNLLCYHRNGKDLGRVRDILLEGSAVKQIVCDRATFTPAQVVSISDNLCICDDSGKPIRRRAYPRPVHAPAPAQAAPRALAPVQSADMRHLAQVASAVDTPAPPQSVTVTRAPGDPVKDYSFLLGKPVRTPVTDGNTVLVPAGAVVTPQIIDLVREKGKLVQLALRAF